MAEPFAPRALLGWAAGLAIVAAVPRRVRLLTFSPWLPVQVVGLVLLGAFGGVAVAAFVWQWELELQTVRDLAVRHRRAARIVRAVVGAAVMLLAVAATVALGWSGEPAGAVGATVAKAVGACLLGAGTALLMLGRMLTATRHIEILRGFVLLGGLALSVIYFLYFAHQKLGEDLIVVTVTLVGLVMMSTLSGSARSGPAVRGVVLGGMVPLVVLMLGTLEDGAVRMVAQAVVAAVAGVVTVMCAVRFAQWHGRLLRFRTAVAILPLGYVMFLWFDGQLLGGPLEAPLFVPMAWLVVRSWRRMSVSGRVTVSASADIVFAVLLGALLVLFLVWLANLLELPPVEVRTLRGAANHLGTMIDLPWWQWAGADALLVAVFLAAALGRGRVRRIGEALSRFRPSGALNALRRTLTILKIVLMSVVFLGLAGPPALAPVLSRTMEDHYTADLQRDLKARGEAALYQRITRQFTRSPEALPVLTQLLDQVHASTANISDPDRRRAQEDDVAHLMGQLQAETLLPRFLTPGEDSPPGEASGTDEAGDAGMHGTAADSADLLHRLTEEQNESADADAREQAQEHAAEHAATVVTGVLGNVTFGHGIVIGLVRQYLDGLAESGLGSAFLRWADRHPSGAGPQAPPTAAEVMEPVPGLLREQADLRLMDELVSQGILTDPARTRADHEPPIAAAVDLGAHIVGLRDHTDHCVGCTHFVEPGGGEPGREEEPRVHGE